MLHNEDSWCYRRSNPASNVTAAQHQVCRPASVQFEDGGKRGRWVFQPGALHRPWCARRWTCYVVVVDNFLEKGPVNGLAQFSESLWEIWNTSSWTFLVTYEVEGEVRTGWNQKKLTWKAAMTTSAMQLCLVVGTPRGFTRWGKVTSLKKSLLTITPIPLKLPDHAESEVAKFPPWQNNNKGIPALALCLSSVPRKIEDMTTYAAYYWQSMWLQK